MADVNDALTANRTAVSELIAAAERSGAVWTVPRAPGKWSPSQVVARARLEGALARFDQECRARATSGQNVVTPSSVRCRCKTTPSLWSCTPGTTISRCPAQNKTVWIQGGAAPIDK